MKPDYLPLYTASQARELDALCISEEKITGFSLMERAALVAFRAIMQRWPNIKTMTVFCGIGNNGGDGYLVAKLATEQGILVEVLQLGNITSQSDDARLARLVLEETPACLLPFTNQQPKSDLIVDAIFGTGITRDVIAEWATAVTAINQSQVPVVALDNPSGLHADSGVILNYAVQADLTVTFVARKQGLYTADGRQVCGEIVFEDLGVSSRVYQKIVPAAFSIKALSGPLLDKRPINSHKKDFGHLLLIGGSPGMRGAIQLAAHAALRSGAGLVTVATHPEHAAYFNLTIPELMVFAITTPSELLPLMDKADAIVIGPGLGQCQWASALFDCAIKSQHPLVVDADALHMLAKQKLSRENWVLTPHPGEAAKLLETTSGVVQADRFGAAEQLQAKYGGICVLKGAGTVIRSNETTVVCSFGNAGMATAGMGDVLAGILGAFLGQSIKAKLSLEQVAVFAVTLHALAGDRAVLKEGEKGLLASDLYPFIRQLINDKT